MYAIIEILKSVCEIIGAIVLILLVLFAVFGFVVNIIVQWNGHKR